MLDEVTRSAWWVVGLGDTLVWSRLREFASGKSEIFAADGRTLQFADIDSARAALLDANFRAFDGLDEEDAAVLGFDLQHTVPPVADNDEKLVPRMTQRLQGHA